MSLGRRCNLNEAVDEIRWLSWLRAVVLATRYLDQLIVCSGLKNTVWSRWDSGVRFIRIRPDCLYRNEAKWGRWDLMPILPKVCTWLSVIRRVRGEQVTALRYRILRLTFRERCAKHAERSSMHRRRARRYAMQRHRSDAMGSICCRYHDARSSPRCGLTAMVCHDSVIAW